MQSNRKVVGESLKNSLGEKRTLLPVSTAVTYLHTRPCAALVKHTSHPNA